MVLGHGAVVSVKPFHVVMRGRTWFLKFSSLW